MSNIPANLPQRSNLPSVIGMGGKILMNRNGLLWVDALAEYGQTSDHIGAAALLSKLPKA